MVPSPGLGDGAQVVDHVGLGHPDTGSGVDDGEGLGIGVRDELDEEILLVVQLAGVSERLIPGQKLSIIKFIPENIPC